MRISIVMPSFNQAAFVEAALRSVITQDYEDWELLFVDGGSTDGTMAIVDRYRDRLAYCVSEPDAGQSDALRKGFERATGDVLTWLSTDDLLLPGALRKVADAFREKPSRSWLLGNVILIDASDRIVRCWRGESFTPGLMRAGVLAAGGPSAFFRRALYDEVGGVDLDFHFQMDTQLWWRFAMAGKPFHRLDGYIWALRLHEEAKTSGNLFAENSDGRWAAIARRQASEQRRVVEMIAPYVLDTPPWARKMLTIARRLASARYLRGTIESRHHKGRNLADFVAGFTSSSRGSEPYA